MGRYKWQKITLFHSGPSHTPLISKLLQTFSTKKSQLILSRKVLDLTLSCLGCVPRPESSRRAIFSKEEQLQERSDKLQPFLLWRNGSQGARKLPFSGPACSSMLRLHTCVDQLQLTFVQVSNKKEISGLSLGPRQTLARTLSDSRIEASFFYRQ